MKPDENHWSESFQTFKHICLMFLIFKTSEGKLQMSETSIILYCIKYANKIRLDALYVTFTPGIIRF